MKYILISATVHSAEGWGIMHQIQPNLGFYCSETRHHWDPDTESASKVASEFQRLIFASLSCTEGKWLNFTFML